MHYFIQPSLGLAAAPHPALPYRKPLPPLQLLSQADFSGLRELLESGEATEEDATQWLHDNIEKYNIYAQVRCHISPRLRHL